MSFSLSSVFRFLAPLLIVAGSAIYPASSLASINFDGATVSADYYFPDAGTVYLPTGNAVVGPGVEFNDVGGFGVGVGPTVDISPTNILITYPAGWNLALGTSFDGWIVSDVLSSIPQIVGASLAGSNIPGSAGIMPQP